MEEAMELIYRIQADHGGRIAESEALELFGGWVADAARRAERLSWLVAKGSPALLMVTYGGRKALDAALASRNALPPPHWLVLWLLRGAKKFIEEGFLLMKVSSVLLVALGFHFDLLAS